MNGEEIKALRDFLGESQTDFAKRIPTSYVIVGRWERGLSVPRQIYMKKLLEIRLKEAPQLITTNELTYEKTEV